MLNCTFLIDYGVRNANQEQFHWLKQESHHYTNKLTFIWYACRFNSSPSNELSMTSKTQFFSGIRTTELLCCWRKQRDGAREKWRVKQSAQNLQLFKLKILLAFSHCRRKPETSPKCRYPSKLCKTWHVYFRESTLHAAKIANVLCLLTLIGIIKCKQKIKSHMNNIVFVVY